MARKTQHNTVQFLTEFAAVKKGDDDALVIPEDLAGLSAEDLTALHEQAIETFDTLYADGKGLSEEDLTTLSALTAGIKSLNAELASRGEADEKRSEAAAALAAEVRPEATLSAEPTEDDGADDTEDADDDAEEEARRRSSPRRTPPRPWSPPAPLASRSSQLAARAGRKSKPAAAAKQSMKDVVRSAETGLGIDWDRPQRQPQQAPLGVQREPVQVGGRRRSPHPRPEGSRHLPPRVR